ncbi:MAG: acetate kinase [Candidatus Wallbacteria bacterium HGW-Wallbacteria-1]|jgi:acetate kinase|uniref:Acetate kinase n=1 Tax=Candidatus Wallbacteria bacterium HGW-Wallbacteria-1 TaxID=2013854 RepID=A0A2N1PP86_9BACT|nr:MAG: acetate kinase [Candidatus Wallbacteria bacterium HGW-Wallbacteria-1]
MKVLVLNCGSSSVKFQLIESDGRHLLAKGVVEKIGSADSIFSYARTGGAGNGNCSVTEPLKKKNVLPIPNHEDAIHMIIDTLTSADGVLREVSEINAVGHRVVHGGENFSGSMLLEPDVIMALTECIELAPLHNPPNLQGIAVASKLLPNAPQIGVFDTAFHQTMPPHAYIYAIPYEYYEKHRIRRYGFHGTSHAYVARTAAAHLGKNLSEMKMITCHLGNGSSITAIDRGHSIDTSMGFTPLEGLVMGTRCGDLDPAITSFIADKEGLTLQQINDILNKKSGVLGISGLSNDMRDVEDEMEAGNYRCDLAVRTLSYRIKKYIGAYAAALGGIDCLVFTGGIGENDHIVRELALENMEFLGISIDKQINHGRKSDLVQISTGKLPVLVVPTDEEMAIALETANIVNKQ